MEHQPQKLFPKENVTNFGSQKTTIQWFRKPEESTHFMLRRFEIAPNGFIGVHSHPEEHQIFVLKGPLLLIDDQGNETQVETEEFIYEPPNEPHGYKNPNKFTVSFLCGIPKLSQD
jgi:quercetin dioxygenase-like cupin family protein